jgi:hypothetical protein
MNLLEIFQQQQHKLKKNGLQINGDLIVTGQIKATCEISNNTFSFSSLNNRINSISR